LTNKAEKPVLTKIKSTFITMLVLAALLAGGMWLTTSHTGENMSQIVFIVVLEPPVSHTEATVTWQIGSRKPGSATFQESGWTTTEVAQRGTPVSMTGVNPGGGKIGCQMKINGHSLYGDSTPQGSGVACNITAFA